MSQADASPVPGASPVQTAPAAPRPMAKAVVRGSAWMIVNTALTRVATFVAQIVLGRLLSDHDFGVYALSISVASIASILRDGGVRQLLVQRESEYEQLVGPTFWMAGAFNLATGALLAAAAPIAARLTGEPEVERLLLVTAVAQPLGTPAAILTSRLAIDLKFGAVAMISGVSAMTRYLATVALALAGMGPMSFVLPLPFLALLEWGMAAWFQRERLWSRPAHVRRWWGMFAQAKWLLLGALGIAGLNLGANLAMKPFAPTEEVGVYFFAFQIVVQVGMLLSANVAAVLYPVFTKLAADPERKRNAVMTTLRQLMLLAGPMCLGLSAIFPPLEQLAWQGKWAKAAPSVMLIGALYPMVIVQAVPFTVQQARGRFRQWALGLLTVSGLGLIAAAAGGAVTGAANGVALATGIAGFISAIIYTVVTLRFLNIGAGDVLGAILPAWIVSLVAGAATVMCDRAVAAALHPLARTILAGAVFCLVFGLGIRLCRPRDVLDTLKHMPVRFREPVLALLRLRMLSEPSAPSTGR